MVFVAPRAQSLTVTKLGLMVYLETNLVKAP